MESHDKEFETAGGYGVRPAAQVPATVTARCDNASVGVLITDHAGNLLLFRRVKPPIGMAPVAGHIDDHGGAEAAAEAEVFEEVGLTVTALTKVYEGWRHNICRRHPGPRGFGHQWTVFRADTIGEIELGEAEAAGAMWCSRVTLQHLADRTVWYAHGLLSDQQFAADPGLEPVWMRFLCDAGLVDVTAADLADVDRLAARSPYA